MLTTAYPCVSPSSARIYLEVAFVTHPERSAVNLDDNRKGAIPYLRKINIQFLRFRFVSIRDVKDFIFNTRQYCPSACPPGGCPKIRLLKDNGCSNQTRT